MELMFSKIFPKKWNEALKKEAVWQNNFTRVVHSVLSCKTSMYWIGTFFVVSTAVE